MRFLRPRGAGSFFSFVVFLGGREGRGFRMNRGFDGSFEGIDIGEGF